MCFSAEASFAGGIILSAVGAATIQKIHKPSQIIFAAIPLFFGVQQIAEGIVWLVIPLTGYAAVQMVFSYVFLVMAEVIWPSLIALSVLFMEEDARRRRTLWVLLGLGMVVSLYYAVCLLTFNVAPTIEGHHIYYHTDFPKMFALPAFIAYLIATITPLFASSIKRTHLLGGLMFFSCLVTVLFFTQYLISVWCFFAAVISAVVYWILSDSKKAFKLENMRLLAERLKVPIRGKGERERKADE
ncbi:MAG TPA: DUF6629 family protein [Williamwhitmania sp.]|nr:DUF6629 family protein [Williamwhitmania sp.]